MPIAGATLGLFVAGSGIRSGLAMRGETKAHERGGFREAAPVATDSVLPCYGWSVKSKRRGRRRSLPKSPREVRLRRQSEDSLSARGLRGAHAHINHAATLALLGKRDLALKLLKELALALDDHDLKLCDALIVALNHGVEAVKSMLDVVKEENVKKLGGA